MTDKETKCGFVAVMGLPNAGKSTLVNALVGSKVSIVTHKSQTTRQRILGIITQDNAQIILIDTPGVFKPRKSMERAMVKAAWGAIPDADIVIHLLDVSTKDPLSRNKMIIEKLPENKPCFLVLNKIDKIKKDDLLKLTLSMNENFDYTATFMISALKKSGLQDVLKSAVDYLPQGPWMFDEDQTTDMPMRLMAAEIVREKIFQQLHEELPYSIAVETESWDQHENGSVTISQIIYIERDGQKGIVLGKGGARIKRIGKEARKDLEEMFDMRIHLNIFVKVHSGAITQIVESSEYGF